eukprot:GDKJ01004496.1.p1 GENE.GDKJ01004496.1~~GDKJ01004496.1.p1  ORF type:complete len:446 (-),score=137.97 GDKJ01004496.1:296-1633(-)
MTIDINMLRADRGGNPEAVRTSELRRGRDGKIVDEVIALDTTWREKVNSFEGMKMKLNAINKNIGLKKKADRNADCTTDLEEAVQLKKEIEEVEVGIKELISSRDNLLHKIGNLVRDDVPISNTEDDNKVVRTWGNPALCKKVDGVTPGALRHDQILTRLKGFDPVKGAEVAGHRGYYLKGPGAMLCMAIWQYGINFLVRKGYEPVQTPFFLRQEIMAKTAELKDFEESLYKIPMGGEKRDDLFLIATSEQPICALHMDETLEEGDLPIRYSGYSTCFRKEAGSAGKDMRGIFRVHQFEKVEQFAITTPEESDAEQERMMAVSEEFYQSLNLPYQVISIVTGALNDAAARKYDLEAWFPSDNTFRELVSCSNCTDYQSRALDIKLGFKKAGDRERRLVHMLNGTLVASQRTMCCILEHYQTENGIRIPPVLVPYMGSEFVAFAKA